MRKILVTGGGGYVGGRVVHHLYANNDYQVLVGSRQQNDSGAADHVTIDWQSQKSLEAACTGVDTILHFAAMNEIDCAKDPVSALQSNGVATARLMEAAKDANVRDFLYLSTIHVYGAPLIGQITEQTHAHPLHPYATSHKAAEDIVLATHAMGKINGLVLRMSNSFGAPVDPNVDRWTLLVNDLCQQAARQGTLTLKSSGLQRRDFITLTDVCRAIEHFLTLDWRTLQEPVFNLGGTWAPTIWEMAQLIADCAEEVLGAKPALTRVEPEQDEQSQPLNFNIDKLLQTGFSLSGSPHQEIIDTLRLCVENK